VVTYLHDYFNKDIFLDKLSEISDNICQDNGNSYINFDKFKEPANCDNITRGMNSLSSVDSLLLNQEKKHIIFVEFKDMNSFEDFDNLKEWFKTKECSVKIKIPDSILLLGYFLKKNGYSFDEFMELEKSFFYVYKSTSSKNKINNHLQYKFTKYNFMLKNIKIIESQSYMKFLEKENL
jgi:hypothetical protein